MTKPKSVDQPHEKEPTKNVIHDFAHYDGRDWPRCQATPSRDEDKAQRQVAPAGVGVTLTGTLGCALPAGHEDFGNPRHQPHSWIRIGA